MIKNRYTFCASLAILAMSVSCTLFGGRTGDSESQDQADKEIEINRVYNIPSDSYELSGDVIQQGQTLGGILNKYGVSAYDVDRLDKAASEVFPLRKIRSGQPYMAFVKRDSVAGDSVATLKLDYLVYEQSKIDFVVFDFSDADSIRVYTDKKQSTARRVKKTAVIESSLWGAIMEAELPYALAAEMENIYQWSIDFFGIQKGDNFTVIYDELFIDDTVSVGIGRVWGAKFNDGTRNHYAIPFQQGDHAEYWEEDGGSLRKQMLKAPLKFSRISSTFTYARLHPIYKVYRPHTGVDYAAPSGTPVHSVGDGVVIYKGWGGGGGNTLKIKHPNNITTGYMHLRGYASGIAVGTKVKQGQTIGYVGSTGASTGPHLDYRVWKGSTPINPLTIPQEPTEPIKAENLLSFEYVKQRVIAELNGEVAAEDQISTTDRTIIDSLTKINPPKIEVADSLVTPKTDATTEDK